MQIQYKDKLGGSIDFSDGNIRAVKVTGAAPQYSIMSAENIFGSGSCYISERMKSREIVITVFIFGRIRTGLHKLGNIFRPKTTGTLYFFDDDIKREINCRFERIDGAVASGTGKADIHFLCCEPFFRDSEEKAGYIGEPVNLWEFDDWELPQEKEYELSLVDKRNAVILNNGGHVDCGCVVRINVSHEVSSIKVRNVTTGEYMKVNMPLAPYYFMTIDTVNKSVILTHKEAGFDQDIAETIDAGSTFFTLAPGDNRIVIETDDGMGGVAAYIGYSELYGGI